jgi:hypothetical protein
MVATDQQNHLQEVIPPMLDSLGTRINERSKALKKGPYSLSGLGGLIRFTA